MRTRIENWTRLSSARWLWMCICNLLSPSTHIKSCRFHLSNHKSCHDLAEVTAFDILSCWCVVEYWYSVSGLLWGVPEKCILVKRRLKWCISDWKLSDSPSHVPWFMLRLQAGLDNAFYPRLSSLVVHPLARNIGRRSTPKGCIYLLWQQSYLLCSNLHVGADNALQGSSSELLSREADAPSDTCTSKWRSVNSTKEESSSARYHLISLFDCIAVLYSCFLLHVCFLDVFFMKYSCNSLLLWSLQ